MYNKKQILECRPPEAIRNLSASNKRALMLKNRPAELRLVSLEPAYDFEIFQVLTTFF